MAELLLQNNPMRNTETQRTDDVLINVEQVSKKFCKSLKRSLWYAFHDILSELNPFNGQGIGHDSSRDLKGVGAPESGSDRPPPLRQGEFWAVRDISFQLRRGECLGLIGHNGAGKSTLLKMINGLIKPDTGRIEMRGRIGALIELGAGFNPILTGRENIYNQASVLGFTRNEIDEKYEAIVEFAEIAEFIDMPVQNYSSGMKVRLGFAVASQMEPDILIIDEVLAVGDVGFRLKCLNQMARLLKQTAVIFVSHSMSQIHRVCTEVIVVGKGALIYQGRDVSQGVAEYFARFPSSTMTSVGSGEIMVESVSASTIKSNSSSGNTIFVEQGAPIIINLTLRGDGYMKKCRLGLVVWNSELYPIADVIADDGKGHVFEMSDSTQTLCSVSIPALNLAAGRYAISLHLQDPDSAKVYCRVDNALWVTIKGSVVGGGGCLIPSAFEQSNGSELSPA